MSKTLGQMLSENEFTVFVNSAAELKARLEAGHQVEYRYQGAYFISQKRGEEYVTVCAMTEDQARADWKLIHDRGYYRDATGARISIPGAR